MTFGSLFSGIGGIDLGLERAGFECRWQCELDPFCRKVLAKHWPRVPLYDDITKLTGYELEPVALVAAGFPCQDLSLAGKRAGLEGARSGLWFDCARIVGVVRPRYVFLENVPGLLDGRAISRVVGELARLGYVGSWLCLRAADFGASHLRKRVFLLAHGNAGRRSLDGAAYDDDGNHASRHDADGRDSHVAYGKAGGRGELREPSERQRLSDGREPLLDDSDSRSEGAWSGLVQSGAEGQRRRRSGDAEPNVGTGPTGEVFPHAFGAGLEIGTEPREPETAAPSQSEPVHLPEFAPGPSDPRWLAILAARPDLAPALANARRPAIWKSTGSKLDPTGDDHRRSEILSESSSGTAAPQSEIRELADGVSSGLVRDLEAAMKDRTKKLKALGNAVVPQCAQWIGERILAFDAEREDE